jgi:hypothetical protein
MLRSQVKVYERIYKVKSLNDINQICVTVSYYKDGNYDIRGPRGYYMHVHPAIASVRDGYTWTTYKNFNAHAYLLKETNEAYASYHHPNNKDLKDAISMIDELLDEPLQAVISENNLKLVTEDYTEQLRIRNCEGDWRLGNLKFIQQA